jgi:hypothetical protein
MSTELINSTETTLTFADIAGEAVKAGLYGDDVVFSEDEIRHNGQKGWKVGLVRSVAKDDSRSVYVANDITLSEDSAQIDPDHVFVTLVVVKGNRISHDKYAIRLDHPLIATFISLALMPFWEPERTEGYALKRTGELLARHGQRIQD